MNRHYVTYFTFCLLLLSGCATESTQRYQFLSETSIAESFSQNGQHKQAASVYQTLAEEKPTHRDEFNLLAAEALVHSGDSYAAQVIIDTINPHVLNTEQRNKLNLIFVQIDLSRGDTERALNRLNYIQPYSLAINDQIMYYQSLAFAHSLSGNLFESAKSRIQLHSLLESMDNLNENNAVILKTLSAIPTQTLEFERFSAPEPISGWIALALILQEDKIKQSPIDLQINLSEWRELFPQHPAIPDFTQASSDELSNIYNSVSSIAVILPESGRFAKAANAIKKGLMAAYDQSLENNQVSIRFYDSSTNPIVSIYNQAVSEGAELVIGPLAKNNIEALALSTELTIPVLALNHVSNLAVSNLFQFGLSPLDSTRKIAYRAAAEGHNKILIFTPESNQGHRIAGYLTDFIQQAGGIVLETQHYNNKGSDFSSSIPKLLNLNESHHRHKKIKQLLKRNIQFTERRRQDVEAIFLSASAQKARSLYPQLQFFRATKVPIYALPQIYSGAPNPSADIDLNSIVFCDIPWLFPTIFSEGLSKKALRDYWYGLPQSYLRVFALGIDALSIASNLESMTTTPYAGATGSLFINQENRITRQLVCAKFIKGQAVIQKSISLENSY